MRRRRPLAWVMLAAFVVGLALMLPFEAAIARIVGMAALITFMVTGIFLVADPEMLEPEDGEDRE